MNDFLTYTPNNRFDTNVECLLVDPKAQLPQRAHPTDAGADLRSCIDITILPNSIELVDTGVAVKIPVNFAGFVYNRSGQGSRGILVANSVGVIDSDYRGPIKVALFNTTEQPYIIKTGDRIAQLVIQNVLICGFKDAWNDTTRGTAGFGSTGTK